jgi:hypothetical protein
MFCAVQAHSMDIPARKGRIVRAPCSLADMIQPDSSSDSPPDRNPTAAHFDVKGRARNEFARKDDDGGNHAGRHGVLMLTHDPPRPPKAEA